MPEQRYIVTEQEILEAVQDAIDFIPMDEETADEFMEIVRRNIEDVLEEEYEEDE